LKWGDIVDVTVNMSVEEFREFMAWKEARDMYEKRESSLRRDMGAKLEGLASAVCRAVKPRDDDQEAFEIVEQGHMSDAWELAQEVFA